MLKSKNFIDRCDNISKDIVFGDDITVCIISTNNNKLMGILIIPEYFINSLIDELNVIIGFCIGVKEIDLSILMLEDEFGSRLVYEHT